MRREQRASCRDLDKETEDTLSGAVPTGNSSNREENSALNLSPFRRMCRNGANRTSAAAPSSAETISDGRQRPCHA